MLAEPHSWQQEVPSDDLNHENGALGFSCKFYLRSGNVFFSNREVEQLSFPLM